MGAGYLISRQYVIQIIDIMLIWDVSMDVKMVLIWAQYGVDPLKKKLLVLFLCLHRETYW